MSLPVLPFLSNLALYVKFNHITIKVPRKRGSGQRWSIIIQYQPLERDMTNYGHIRHRITNTDQFPKVRLKMVCMTYAPASGIYFIIWHLQVPYALL